MDNKIFSAAEIYNMDIQPPTFFWGDLFRTKSRMAIVGKPKTGKSFFAMQLSFHLAIGTPFLGMETTKARGLYINFEISQAKLQQRIQDLCGILDIAPPEHLLFHSPTGVALDEPMGAVILEGLVEDAIEQMGGLDYIVIDPRRNSMSGDENKAEIMTRWNSHVDEVAGKHELAVIVVHHEGKRHWCHPLVG